MTKRAHNFNAGPGVLPFEVVEEASRGVLEFGNTGMSIMEMSHRSKEYDQVIREAASDLLELLGSPAGYKALFVGGGASLQFAMVPMNFLPDNGSADYINTGVWASKAVSEAKMIGKVNVVASSEDKKFTYIPDLSKVAFTPGAAYLHITTNNTIYGTEYHTYPDPGNAPLVADMSSNFLSRPFDLTKFSLIYAGAQKNVGPSGVVIVLVREDMLEKTVRTVPTMMNYKTHYTNDSLYNTPPCVNIYVVGLVMKWLKKNGGLADMEQRNIRKAAIVYDAIDGSGGFYRGTVEKESRSRMNIPFRLPSEELEEKFVKEGKAANLIGLKGHRSVGGIRASTYNALPEESCQVLADFMKEFARKNG